MEQTYISGVETAADTGLRKGSSLSFPKERETAAWRLGINEA